MSQVWAKYHAHCDRGEAPVHTVFYPRHSTRNQVREQMRSLRPVHKRIAAATSRRIQSHGRETLEDSTHLTLEFLYRHFLIGIDAHFAGNLHCLFSDRARGKLRVVSKRLRRS
jgi:hypothetical protein